MKGVIDRFEGNIAVVQLEDEKVININKKEIPMEAKEGDVLDIGSNITIDYDETKKRKEKIDKLTKDLWE